MTGPAVLIIEPESSGIALVDAARSLNLVPRVLDRRPLGAAPEEVRRAVGAGRATYLQVETRSASEVAAVAAGLGTVRAVLPGFEYAVPVAAAVARALGLPGLGVAAAAALRDKRRMKAALAAAGLPVSRGRSFDVRERADGLTGIAGEIGFPAVVKPVDGSGSIGVRRVDDLPELRRYLRETESCLVNDLGRLIGHRLLLEEYLDGPEYSVEGYVSRGEVVVVAVTEKQLGPEPHFVEIGHIVEAGLPAAGRAALERTAVAAVTALGLTIGVFHLEARLTRRGPVVVEVGARLGGDRIPQLVRLTRGYDLPEVMIRCFAGLPVAPPAGSAQGVAAVRHFAVSRPARLVDPTGLASRLARLPGCVEVIVDPPPGGELPPATDFRHRFGHLMLAAPDRTALAGVLDQADGLLGAATAEVAECAS